MSQELPVLPDATFTLGGHRYFVEIDRGTTNLDSWAEKVKAYEAYRRSPKLQARYTTDSFTVLVVAPALNRLQRIAEEVMKVTRQPSRAYLFTTRIGSSRPRSGRVEKRSPAPSGNTGRSLTESWTSLKTPLCSASSSGETLRNRHRDFYNPINALAYTE